MGEGQRQRHPTSSERYQVSFWGPYGPPEITSFSQDVDKMHFFDASHGGVPPPCPDRLLPKSVLLQDTPKA